MPRIEFSQIGYSELPGTCRLKERHSSRSENGRRWANPRARAFFVALLLFLPTERALAQISKASISTCNDAPTEKWVYEIADLKTRVITFKEGKVAKVDEF